MLKMPDVFTNKDARTRLPNTFSGFFLFLENFGKFTLSFFVNFIHVIVSSTKVMPFKNYC